MGIAASIAHEVNQPLAAVVNAAAACRRWIDGGTPNLVRRRDALWMDRQRSQSGE